MGLKIYNQNDELKLTVEPSDNSTRQKSIQADHVLSLSFTSFEFVRLDVNDYVEFLGQRFWIIEQYIPKQVSTVEWEYNCRFYGPENLIGQALVLKIVDGEDDPVFSLTAPAQVHVELVVENLNRQMGTTDWKVGEVIATGNITIDYKGTYCNAGLKMIAEKAETEYWIDGMTVNLCRCEYGEAIPLGYDNGALSIEVSSADNVKFFTRLFPVGSSRNIDRSVYGHTRLQLPDGQKYIERDVDLGVVEHYEEAAFAHIYPRRVGTISGVRSEVKTNEDGTPFTIYYFEDMELPFDPNEYEIGGLVKQITFQSGELNGRDFEVNYNSEVGEFEIITQWPYDDDTQIPGGTLIPKAGDEYILWNIRMPNEYYDLASQEYAEAVDAYMAKHRKDHRVYKVPTNYVDIERRGLVFDIGQRIRLESAEHFVDGYRDSRISSFSQNVNIPTMYDLEISDVISMGTVTQIKSDVNEIRNFTQTTAASLPGIIRSWENTPASDFNLFSAKKQVVEFLSKRNGGQVLGIVSFLRDIILGGNAQTTDFVKGNIGGSGAGLYRDESGNTVFEADKLIVRQEASFNELTINQISFQLGETVFSAGGCTITKVGEGSDFYRCYYDNKEGNRYSGFQAGDYARCQQFDATNQVQTKYYWRLVVNVGDDYVDLSKADCDGTGIPATGDDIVQFGNRFEVARQSAVVISPHSGGSIVILSGVDSYSLVGKNYVGIGVDASTGKAYMYGYGDVLIGDRDKSGQYVEYKNGKLIIKADVTLGSDSDLSDVEAFAKLEQINDDLYLTPIEKRSLRQQINNIIDGEGTTLPYWAAIGYESRDVEWYQVEKGNTSNGLSQDAWEDWWSSGIAGAPNTASTMLVYVQTNRKTNHSFDLLFASDAESSFDYLIISGLGQAVNQTSTEHSLTDMSKQANTLSRQNQVLTKTYSLGKIETSLEVVYKKDGSANKNTDAGYFKVVADTADYWENGIQYLAAYGSYPSVYSALTSLELTEIRDELTGRLEALVNYVVDNGEIWGENADITTSVVDGFRSEVNRLLSRYYAYEAQCDRVISEAEANKALSDIEYLKQVFPNAILDVNGATLSLLLGVKDGATDDSKIVAGLYGGGAEDLNTDLHLYDTDHGVLMFFAGADDLNMAYTANTRIYADGTLFTNNIIATGGKIGGFAITEDQLTAKLDDNSDWTEMILRSSSINFLNYYNRTLTTQICIGNDAYGPGVGYIIAPVYIRNAFPNNALGENRGILVSSSGGTGTNTGVMATAKDGSENYAFWGTQGDIRMDNGVFYGLRPNLKVVTISGTLGVRDCIVCCNNTAAITLTLPSSPVVGQMYIIRRLRTASSGSITIKTSKSSQYLLLNAAITEVTTTSLSLSSYKALELHYAGTISDKDVWIANYLTVS